MASEAAKHKQQVASLEKAYKGDRVKILQEFQDSFKNSEYSDPDVVKDIFKNSNLLSILAGILDETNSSNWPKWINGLMDGLSNVSAVKDLFPLDQFRTLSDAFKKHILGGNWNALSAYSLFACFEEVKAILKDDDQLYNTLKKEIKRDDALQFFYNVTSNDAWQLKLLADQQLIRDLLALPENDDVWDLFFNLARNKDAKDLLPKDVIIKANKSPYVRCTDLCALLCNDNDLHTLKISDSWIDRTANLLQSLLKDGKVESNGTSYELLDLILPLANFSAVYSKQEALGKRIIPLLLKVLTDDLPKSQPIQGGLKQGQFEAALALWNLSYLESNRSLINSENAVPKLKTLLQKADDPAYRKSIEGILYMLSAPFSAPQQPSGVPIVGHVMLSYNWGSQQTVLKISKSLKDLGYKVWLDVDQMKGDTLEAMAKAIEQADLVLICMSQKYKDSANCRLEGEYCVNRKVAFVPLMMQQGYQPDGWCNLKLVVLEENVDFDFEDEESYLTNLERLGITLGSRLYYDFSNDKDWDQKIAELAKAIGSHGKGNSVRQAVPAPASPAVSGGRKPVVDWDIDDIRTWLKTEQIEHHFEAFRKHKFDGKALVELKGLLVPQNPSFFTYIGEVLQVTELGEMLRLFAAIRKL
eukprot:Phypoly_transcript_05233.p1 GENE.Phypoly_transcript_05233~~Phypoly_transcript_05233.p1  ORF type:complete len:642 (+),score=115.18 Phypoly_transcript_05233:54-1979(+)